VCVQGINDGPSCRYDAVKNEDGSNSDYTFRQTGTGCACNGEVMPCAPLGDGEVTDFPQGEGGCYQMGEFIACEADPSDKCPNGICEEGCGYVENQFVCVQAQDEDAGRACQANDSRITCDGRGAGECPVGVSNCTDNPDNPTEEPPPACEANDPRPECVGVPEGQAPEAGEGGASSDDISDQTEKLGGKLDQVNKNLKSINDDTTKIKDALTDEVELDDLSPESHQGWSDTISAVEQFTSSGDINQSEVDFKSNFESNEGFFNTQIEGLLPVGGGCQNITMDLPRASVVIDFCSHVGPIKIILEWAVVLAFFIYLRDAFIRLKPE